MSIKVGIGLANFPFSNTQAFWRWVDLCETGGVDSIWQSDRLSGRDPNLDCLSVMAALAGATQRIKFGMNVASVALRDPFVLAKQCATIDVLSNGRLLPAFGIGSALSKDYTATGTPTKGRGKRANEALQLIARLWKEDSVTFNGEYFQYENASVSPKPVQKNIPMWVGGTSDAAVERTVKYATGWQAGLDAPADVKRVVSAIRAKAKEYDKKIDDDHYGAGFAYRFGSPDDPVMDKAKSAFKARLGREVDDLMVAGDTEIIMQTLKAYVDAGASKFILRPIAKDDEDWMVQTRALIEQILPAVDALNP